MMHCQVRPESYLQPVTAVGDVTPGEATQSPGQGGGRGTDRKQAVFVALGACCPLRFSHTRTPYLLLGTPTRAGCTGLISAGYKITWDKGSEGEGEEGSEDGEVRRG